MAKKNKPKKLVVLIETLNRGGIETVLLRLLPKLKKEGWDGVVVTIKGGGEMLPEYEAAGISVIPLNQRYFIRPGALRLISQTISDLNPDLIMTTLFKADMIGRLFLRFTISEPVVPYLVTTYNHPRYRIARVLEWITKPLVSAYIANSPAVKEFYEKTLNVGPGKIDVLPNAVDTKIFEVADGRGLREELGLPSDAFLLTCVANLAPNKGQTYLLEAFEEAFAEEPSAYLLLVGEGELREILMKKREGFRSKDRIILLGRRTDVPKILNATTVFVLPTLFEGMSTALLEAMAAGKAIVTTSIPENKVLLTHRDNALLVNPRDPKNLVQALKEMFANSSLRKRLGKRAYRHVVENYSIERMAWTCAEILNKLGGVAADGKARVVHVISSLQSGGAENMLLRTLPPLNDDEFEQIVVTLFRQGELAPKLRKKGIKSVNIGLSSLADTRSMKKLKDEVSKYKPGLVITYLFHAHYIGRLYLQERISAPVIPFLRTTYNFPRYVPVRLLERITKGLVRHYFANSEAVKDYYVKNMRVSPPKITVIPNGIDLTIFDRARASRVVRELNLPHRRFVISCVANLAQNKGHTFLLEAFEKMFQSNKNLWLLLVGEGREEKALKRQIERYVSRGHIKFLGRRHDVPDILAASDAFVLPTLFEGMSNAVLEAMAAGLPVVTTDIPENRAIITDGVNGFLVKKGDPQTIQDTLKKVIGDDRLRERVGREARAHIAEHFEISKVAQKWRRTMRRWTSHE
jgi:glycosyltransferase involved in cell wall biosynthesis